MTGIGHEICAACVCAPMLPWVHAHPVGVVLACAGMMLGANAPDHLERIWGFRVIPHRTWTHWPAWWAAALLAAGIAVLALPSSYAPLAGLVAGYAGGGLLHLVLDFGSPMGIPLAWQPVARMTRRRTVQVGPVQVTQTGKGRWSLMLYTTGTLRDEARIIGWLHLVMLPVLLLSFALSTL